MRPMLEVLANKNLPFKVARYVRSVASKAGNAFTKAIEGQRALPYKVAEHDPQSGKYNVLASFNTREAAENHPTGTHIIQTQQWWAGHQANNNTGQQMARRVAAGFVLPKGSSSWRAPPSTMGTTVRRRDP
jgi:hypothetical protein